MVLSAEEKAAKRAQALARLEATKQRIAGGRPQGGISSSGVSAPTTTASSSTASAVAGGSAAAVATIPAASPQTQNTASPNVQANAPGQAKPTQMAQTNRNGTAKSGLLKRPYIEYDLSTMKDSKGGFIQPEEGSDRWLERLPPHLPPLPLDHPDAPQCFDCGTKDLNFRLYNVFKTRVCNNCRKRLPEKYSMLTKTECKQDYLLTEPELKDEEILPHMERPNPHKDNYSNMMLYMRYQAEEFAFKKWGGEAGLDAEYERRETKKVERKKIRFDKKLKEMRKKTRAQAITGKTFDRHQHEWHREPRDDGTVMKKCDCGMQVTEVQL